MNDFVQHEILGAAHDDEKHASHRTKASRREELLAQIKNLLPQIAATARQTETDHRVPAAHVDALRKIGFFDLVRPAQYGGSESGFELLVEANLLIAQNCASTAWVCGLLSAHQWLLSSFPEQAQEDVWGTDPHALVCGSYAPTSKATVDKDGYRLTGQWSFASGCENSSWAFCAAIIPSLADPEKMEPAFLLVPDTDYEISDTWDVIGLAGTGSKTLVLDNVLVPKHRVLTFAQSTSGQTPGADHYASNPTYRIPMLTMIPSCLASAAVGAAEGALQSYLAATGGRVTRGAVAGAHQKMAEFPTIQLRVAEASASADAAREILLRDIRNITEKALRGEEFDVEDRITSRRGQSFAVLMSLRAMDALNASTGGLGLQMSNPVQRAWRDVNAVGRHISMNWDAVGTMYGQMAFGLPPRGQY